jgi:hypothetical protein
LMIIGKNWFSLIQTIRHFANVNKRSYNVNVVIDIFLYRGMESLSFCLLILFHAFMKSRQQSTSVLHSMCFGIV